MALASIAFILVRRRIGRRMLTVDQDRLRALSHVGENVDETIASARTISGLHLTAWQVARVRPPGPRWSSTARIEQGVVVSRLILAAHAAAFTGLVVVVVFALALGGEDLAGVAAALLYVEGAVRGLEALPPWIRDVQLAAASQQRLDDVLDLPDRIVLPADAPGPTPDAPAGLALEGVTATLSTGVALTGANRAAPPGHRRRGRDSRRNRAGRGARRCCPGTSTRPRGRVTLDGADVRTPELAHHLFYVPDDAEALSASLMDLLRAVSPGITLGSEQLSWPLPSPSTTSCPCPTGWRSGSVPAAAELTVSETAATHAGRGDRCRAPRPSGGLTARAGGRRQRPPPHRGAPQRQRRSPPSSASAAARSPEAVDQILFVAGGRATLGTHQELLVAVPEYAHLWEQRLSTTDVDLSVVGIDEADQRPDAVPARHRALLPRRPHLPAGVIGGPHPVRHLRPRRDHHLVD